DDYTLVNLALRKDFAESGLALGATIRNLFDEDGAEPAEFGQLYVTSDYPIQGRAAYIDLTYTIR
ncbi:MAG: hypothetical protein WBN40_08845, partial [Pseudomonadales bacterium]